MTPLRGYQEGFSYCGEGVGVTAAGLRMVWSVYFQDACRVRMDVWGCPQSGTGTAAGDALLRRQLLWLKLGTSHRFPVRPPVLSRLPGTLEFRPGAGGERGRGI